MVPQTIQYRNTGVILRVRPVIHAGDRIDLEVSQEVSSAEPTTTGVTTSPTIRRRAVDTKLSLRDGATIMLGGLISETNTQSDSGVPLLKDIPGVGSLFKSSTKSRTRTELVMLITPYVLNDVEDAQAATDAYQDTLGAWADSVRARVKASRAARQAPGAAGTGAAAAAPAKGPQAADKPAAPPAPPAPLGSAPDIKPLPGEPPVADILEPLQGQDGAEEPPAPNHTPTGERMINLSDRQPGAADSAPANASPGAPAGQDDGQPHPSQAPAPSGKPAPASINGTAVPAGATVVDDPKLIEEILNSTRKR